MPEEKRIIFEKTFEDWDLVSWKLGQILDMMEVSRDLPRGITKITVTVEIFKETE